QVDGAVTGVVGGLGADPRLGGIAPVGPAGVGLTSGGDGHTVAAGVDRVHQLRHIQGVLEVPPVGDLVGGRLVVGGVAVEAVGVLDAGVLQARDHGSDVAAVPRRVTGVEEDLDLAHICAAPQLDPADLGASGPGQPLDGIPESVVAGCHVESHG